MKNQLLEDEFDSKKERNFKAYSLLKIGMYLMILLCLGKLLLDYDTLAAGEGWGVMAVLSMLFFSTIGLILDFILYKFVRSKSTYHLLGALMLVIFLLALEPWQIA